MWGKILICLTLVLIIGCHGAAITCDPQATTSSCPNAPNGLARICDPTGICQIQCNNSSDCTDPGTICDHSSDTIPLCQNDCSVTGCPRGQTCRNYNITPTPTGDQPLSQQTCKELCPDTGKSCAGNSIFSCWQTASGNLNICWGTPTQ